MATPAELARTVFRAIDEQDEALLEQLIHPDAMLEMAMARGELVQGRGAVLDALKAAWQGIHTLRIDELHPLSEEAVIIVGRSRYPTSGGGFADSGLVWLCEYRDAMLWRQQLFVRVEDARTAYAASTIAR